MSYPVRVWLGWKPRGPPQRVGSPYFDTYPFLSPVLCPMSSALYLLVQSFCARTRYQRSPTLQNSVGIYGPTTWQGNPPLKFIAILRFSTISGPGLKFRAMCWVGVDHILAKLAPATIGRCHDEAKAMLTFTSRRKHPVALSRVGVFLLQGGIRSLEPGLLQTSLAQTRRSTRRGRVAQDICQTCSKQMGSNSGLSPNPGSGLLLEVSGNSAREVPSF